MSIRDLQEAVLDQGIRHTNFFEGRLLTGDDLRNQREANREIDRRLAQAIGPGIIDGLEVKYLDEISTASEPKLSVSKGLAINKNGDVFGLPDNDITLQLVRTLKTPVFDKSDFYLCAGPPGEQQLPSGAGIYLLVMYPVAGYTEKAPKSGLGDSGIARGCGNKYIQEGVEFRLVQVDRAYILEHLKDKPQLVSLLENELLNENNPIGPSDLKKKSQLRNLLANIFLGAVDTSDFISRSIAVADNDYWQTESSFVRLLHDLELRDKCGVSLGLVFWTLEGVAFFDSWTVRRILANSRMRRNDNVNNNLLSCMQFQEQLQQSSSLNSLVLRDHFLFVPPIFHVPVLDLDLGSIQGVALNHLLGVWHARIPDSITADEVPALFESALRYPAKPISDISHLHVIYLRENLSDLESGDEDQLYAYIVQPEVAKQMCLSFQFKGQSMQIEPAEMSLLFQNAAQAYQDFKRIIFWFGTSDEIAMGKEDMLGTQMLDNVIASHTSASHTLLEPCCPSHELWQLFTQVAEIQADLTEIWQTFVLPSPNGDKYISQIHQVMDRVHRLVHDDSAFGLVGLKEALSTRRMVEAYVTQSAIIQAFHSILGTGANGVIELDYISSPVAGPGGAASELVPGEYIFGFDLYASIDRRSNFKIEPKVEGFGWQVILVDESGQNIPTPQLIGIPKSNSPGDDWHQFIRVKLIVPDIESGSARMNVSVAEEPSGGGVPPAEQSIMLTLGEPIPAPDNRVSIRLTGHSEQIFLSGTNVNVPRFGQHTLNFEITSNLSGEFESSVGNEQGGEWNILRVSTDTFSGTAPFNEAVDITMNPGSNAANTDLLFRIRSTSLEDPEEAPFEETFRIHVILLD